MDPRGVSIQPQGGREAGLKTAALALTAGRPGVVSGWMLASSSWAPPSPGPLGPDHSPPPCPPGPWSTPCTCSTAW